MAEAAVRDPYTGLAADQVAGWYGLRASGITPTLGEYTRKLWAYRHFIIGFSAAKHAATYANAHLGRIWQVLTPIVNAAVYYLVFGIVLNTRQNIDNFVAYLCVGIFLFGFTQSVALACIKSISGNMGLVRALHFPRASLPIATLLTQVQQMFTAIGVLFVIVFLTGERFALRWLLIVPVIVLQVVFNAGLAMILARLGSRSTDLGQLMPFLMRTWMYASGVFYSVQVFFEYLPSVIAHAMQLNPMLVYIELARLALLESPPAGSSPVQLWLLAGAWAVIIGLTGYVYFWRGEQGYGRG